MNKILTAAVIVAVVGGAAWYFLMADDEGKRKAKVQMEIATSDVKHVADQAMSIGEGVKTAGQDAGPQAVANAKKCRENLKRIESAKRAAAQKRVISLGDVPLDAILAEMGLKELPKCPSGGDYIIGPVNTMVRCNIGANGTADPNDDHHIRDY